MAKIKLLIKLIFLIMRSMMIVLFAIVSTLNTMAQLPTAVFETKNIEKSVSVGQQFASTASIPFESQQQLVSLSVSGVITLQDEQSYVRVVAITNAGNELLVLNACVPYFRDSAFIKNWTEETAVMEPVNIVSLQIEISNATLQLDSISFTTVSKKKLSGPTATQVQLAQQYARIEYLNSLHLGWTAAMPPTLLSYAELKQKWGVEVLSAHMMTFQYYSRGVWNPTEKAPVAMKEISKFVKSFRWSEQHRATSSSSPYYNANGIGWLTNIRDQQGCGSCWAFAAIGTMEAYANLYFNNFHNFDMSEQDAVCHSRENGCSGGWASEVFKYAKQKGIVDENCLPYQADDVTCETCPSPNEKFFLIDTVRIQYGLPMDSIKAMLIKYGPLALSINSMSHEMMLDGWETDASGNTIWVWKNSWGTWSGNDGFMRTYADDIGMDAGLRGPIWSTTNTYEVQHKDLDGDGLYFCGIGNANGCSIHGIQDGNDSNPFLGHRNQYGFCEIFYSAELDSLALVVVYTATNGVNWTNHANWLTGPVSSWHGITTNAQGRVIAVNLANNNLVGTLPMELSYLNKLQILNVSNNSLSGNIPYELGDLENVQTLNLSHNQFSGAVPEELTECATMSEIDFSFNQLQGIVPDFSGSLNMHVNVANNQFTDIESLERNVSVFTDSTDYAPQNAEISVATKHFVPTGGTLHLDVSVTGNNNMYQWYRNDTLQSTASQSQYTGEAISGLYSCKITNTVLPGLALWTNNIEVQVHDTVYVASTTNYVADFDNISDAVAACDSGIVVFVYPGYYQENIVLKNGITIIGYEANVFQRMSFEGLEKNPIIVADSVSGSIIIGINFHNGNINYGTPYKSGCANITNSTIAFVDCSFLYNNGWQGGAIYAKNSTVFLTGGSFQENSGWGACIYADSSETVISKAMFLKNNWKSFSPIFQSQYGKVVIDSCSFAENGGGVQSFQDSVVIKNSNFINNKGSIIIDNAVETTEIQNCEFRSNTSEGTIISIYSTPGLNFVGNKIQWNTTQNALMNINNCSGIMSQNLIAGNEVNPKESNQKYGVVQFGWGSNISFNQNTVVNNYVNDPNGYGILSGYGGVVNVNSSIFWGNHPYEFGNENGSISLAYSHLGFTGYFSSGISFGGGNITGGTSPNFDWEAGDYFLAENSPCVNAGDPSLLLDPDGTIADMGYMPYYQYYLNLSQESVLLNWQKNSTDTMTITTSYDSFTTESYLDWATVQSDSTSKIIVTATENPVTTLRTGVVLLHYGDNMTKVLQIMQKGRDYIETQDSVTLDWEAGIVRNIPVTSNVDWDVVGGTDWLFVTKQDNQVTLITLANNESQVERTTNVVLSGGGIADTILVKQMPKPYLEISTDSVIFDVVGGIRSIAVASNVRWSIVSNIPWVSVYQTENGFDIVASNNTDTVARSGFIFVRAINDTLQQQVFVTQKGVPYIAPYIEVQDSITLNWEVGIVGTVAVQSNIDWVASSDVNWLFVTKQGDQLTLITLASNEDQLPRTTTVVLSGEGIADTISVMQLPKPYITTSTDSVFFDVVGGMESISVESNYTWSYDAPDAWLFVTNENDQLHIVAFYNESNSRTATITLLGENISKEIIITQKGQPTTAVETVAGNHEITVYPNPATDFVNITNIEVGDEIMLCDLSGKILSEQIATSNVVEISLSDLARGIYLVKVQSEKGVLTTKLVKR